ncbi:MAG: hypothetical protein ABL886_09015 [Rhodoglobus sp.]
MAFKDTLKSLFRRPRAVTREHAAEIADWVNEGGTFDPAGPPRVIEEETSLSDDAHKGNGRARPRRR